MSNRLVRCAAAAHEDYEHDQYQEQDQDDNDNNGSLAETRPTRTVVTGTTANE
ncbi:Hypothetical predicted protein [Drosophila guanche]|uniref:Uncharacterized protein n=1 Tax=Drosophila guanche TaxID=7266 RepID=A0A3B0JPY6_DROGU|nr:Hypothetical predicted protein [Drosophila guanche]